jgi:hypothetical protein
LKGKRKKEEKEEEKTKPRNESSRVAAIIRTPQLSS